VQLEGWRSQLDKDRASLDAGRSELDRGRAEVSAALAKLDERKRLAEVEANAIVDRAQSEADAVLDQAWKEAERLIGGAKADAEDHEGTVAELRRQIERREEELSTTNQAMVAREQKLTGAEVDLREAQHAFEIQRTDLLREAREQGYELGWAEAEAAAAAKQARRAAIDTGAEGLEPEPKATEIDTEPVLYVAEEPLTDEASVEAGPEPAPIFAFTQEEPELTDEASSQPEATVEEAEVDLPPIGEVHGAPDAEDTGEEKRLRVVKEEGADHEEVNEVISKLRSAWTGEESTSTRSARRKWRNSSDR
jgi:hypothetical protein